MAENLKIKKKEIKYYGTFTPGVYNCYISNITEEVRYNRFSNVEQAGIFFEFSILEPGLEQERAYTFLSASLTQISNLTKLSDAVMGRPYTIEEMASITGVDSIKKFLLNKPLVIIINNNVSRRSGAVYYKITAFAPSRIKEGEFTVLPIRPIPTLYDTGKVPTGTLPNKIAGHENDEL